MGNDIGLAWKRDAWAFALVAVLFWATPAFALDLQEAHWCRNGAFSSEPRIAVARVIGASRVYLRWDGGSLEGCPANDACRHGYVLAGQEVLAGKSMGDYVCVYYPGSGSAGWVPANSLAGENPLPASTPRDWTGHWVIDHREDSVIDIQAVSGGLAADGEAYWPARHVTGGQVQHDGGFSATASPRDNELRLAEETCEVALRLIGAYLIATDNSNCGGANVRFDGVYTRVVAQR